MSRRSILAALALTLACLTARSASQTESRPVFGMGTIITLGSGIFSDRTTPTLLDADLLLRCVELDDETATLARSIIAQVDAATEAAQRDFEAMAADFESETDMLQMPIPIARRQAEAIRSAVGELSLIVPDDQADRFDDYLRRTFRERYVAVGARFGERTANLVDLQSLAEDQAVWSYATADPDDSVTIILRAWAREIDAIARKADRDFLELMEHLDEIRKLEESGELSTDRFPERLRKLGQRLNEGMASAIELTHTSADRLARSMPQDAARAFTDAFNLRAFPEVYRQRSVERWLDAQLEGDALTEPERRTLQSIRTALSKDAAELRAAYRRSIEDFADARAELELGGDTPEFWQVLEAVDAASQALEDAFTEARRRVLAELTPDRARTLGLNPDSGGFPD